MSWRFVTFVPSAYAFVPSQSSRGTANELQSALAQLGLSGSVHEHPASSTAQPRTTPVGRRDIRDSYTVAAGKTAPMRALARW